MKNDTVTLVMFHEEDKKIFSKNITMTFLCTEWRNALINYAGTTNQILYFSKNI